MNGGSGNTTGIISEFLYDIDHRLASQINISTAKLTRANIYAGGEFLAEDAPDAAETGTPVATQMRITDQVGSLRGRWDYAGKQNGGCTSFPYGDGFSCTNPPVSTAEFTGKDRDNESALDYFGARYYSNRMGRFTTPDDPFIGQDPSDPQSLNLYSYVLNNPLTDTDPDGHDVMVCDGTSGHCTTIPNDVYTAAQQSNNGGLNVPTLDQVGSNGDGSGHFNATAITDSSGNQVGTATYVSDGGADYYANAMGYQQLAGAARVVNAVGLVEMNAITMFAGELLSTPSVGAGLSGLSKPAAAALPKLAGASRAAAREALQGAGFKQKGITKGGYETWVHPDGSKVTIGPDGGVDRLPPTSAGRGWRYDSDGNQARPHTFPEEKVQ